MGKAVTAYTTVVYVFEHAMLHAACDDCWLPSRTSTHEVQHHATPDITALWALIVCAIMQAMLAAQESVSVQPTVAKSWVRLGDAYRDLGRCGLGGTSDAARAVASVLSCLVLCCTVLHSIVCCAVQVAAGSLGVHMCNRGPCRCRHAGGLRFSTYHLQFIL